MTKIDKAIQALLDGDEATFQEILDGLDPESPEALELQQRLAKMIAQYLVEELA